MEKKIFSRICAVSVCATILACILMIGVLYTGFSGQTKTQVREDASVLAGLLNSAGDEDTGSVLADVVLSQRVTVVEPDGDVRYDSTGVLTENHADRPEIKAALLTGVGEVSRLSATLQQQTFYYAVKLNNGDVLRVSRSADSVYASTLSCLPFILVIIAFISVSATIVAHSLTVQVVSPINNIDVENPMRTETYDELTPLLLRIDKQNNELEKQMQTMQHMRDDLAEVMEGMSEALIVLDGDGKVLSCNRSAVRLFNLDERDIIGKSVLQIDRGKEFRGVYEAVNAGEEYHDILTTNGYVYAMSLSHAQSSGSLLMLVDITERQEAEQMRREFSANVSHELKTPLQSISGYAELLKSGMVKPEDRQRFAENIYQETHRMISLVQDIIDLSRLDEGGVDLPRTQVDLFDIAKTATENLRDKAQRLGISLTIHGGAAPMVGVEALLAETIFNLADNAITYNHRGGTADVRVEQTENAIKLVVTDTGLGIPQKDIPHIFERFYRVDKSHSRATGGTGLGLSIVKHAVYLHNGVINVTSNEGVGTTITITFPKETTPAQEQV